MPRTPMTSTNTPKFMMAATVPVTCAQKAISTLSFINFLLKRIPNLLPPLIVEDFVLGCMMRWQKCKDSAWIVSFQSSRRALTNHDKSRVNCAISVPDRVPWWTSLPLPAIPHLFAVISEIVCSLFPKHIMRRSQSVRRIDVIISVGLSSHIAKVCCYKNISKYCHVVRVVDSFISLTFKRYSGTSCGPFASVA